MLETDLFQTIQLSYIWSIDRTLSVATTPSEPGSNGNKGAFRIPESSRITGATPSDCFVSHSGHLVGDSYSFGEMQFVYSTPPVDWARKKLVVPTQYSLKFYEKIFRKKSG